MPATPIANPLTGESLLGIEPQLLQQVDPGWRYRMNLFTGRALTDTALDGEAGDKAKQIVENLTKNVVVGETYVGTVTRVIPIGAFMQILPGKEGLVHISQLAPQRVERVEDVVNVGDEISVKVMEIDGQGRLNLSRKAVLGSSNGSGDRGGRGDRDGRRAPRSAAEPAEYAEAPPAAATTDAPGAPPMRRRRRPHGRRED